MRDLRPFAAADRPTLCDGGGDQSASAGGGLPVLLVGGELEARRVLVERGLAARARTTELRVVYERLYIRYEKQVQDYDFPVQDCDFPVQDYEFPSNSGTDISPDV